MFEAIESFVRRYRHVNLALCDQALISGANFLTAILLARGLGISEFGRYSIAWLAVLFVQRLQHALVITPMMSIGPKQAASESSTYYNGVMLQQAAFAILSTMLTWIFVSAYQYFLTGSSISELATPIAVAVFTTQYQDFGRRYFFAIQNPLLSIVSDGIRYIGQIVAVVWILFVARSDMTAGGVLWIMSLTSFSACVVLISVTINMKYSLDLAIESFRRHWRLSIWLAPSSVLQWLSRNMFIIITNGILGTTAVGALKATQTLVGITHILFQGLENIIPVRAAQRFSSGGRSSLFAYLRKTSIFVSVTALFIVLVFASAPGFWIKLTFGEEFLEYSYLVRWYAAFYVLLSLGLPLRYGLLVIEKTAPLFVAYLIATTISLGSIYFLIDTWGLSGTMIGMIGFQLVFQCTLIFFLRRTTV